MIWTNFLAIFLILLNKSNGKCLDEKNNFVNLGDDQINIYINSSQHKSFSHFWKSTGFCPPDPHNESAEFMLSPDMKQNIALIGSLPYNGIEHIRIHYLLKLISIENSNNKNIKLNFTYLDRFLDYLKQYRLKPGFELMGNPSFYFSNFQDNKQLHEWKNLVKDLAKRYIEKYGMKYVSNWNFECWNEPDISHRKNNFDKINVTLQGFINYYDACSKGLEEAANSTNFILGGPGDHWPKTISNQSFVIGLLRHCSSGKNYFSNKYNDTKLDFISLHEKGASGNTFAIDKQETKAIEEINKYFPSLKNTSFVNNEGDPEVGWDRDRWWRADAHYSSIITSLIIRRILNWNFSNKLSLFSNDNGFLSYHPYHFTQRTLLARFQMNLTHAPHVQFVRKPGYTVMGLLAKLGNNILFTNLSKQNTKLSAIGTSYNEHSDKSSNPSDYSILIVNGNEAIRYKGSTKINLSLHSEQFNKISDNWKWVQYTIDNTKTNPYKIWRQHDCPSFPSDEVFERMRSHEGPYIHGEPKSLKANKGIWNVSLSVEIPSVTFIHLCKSSNRTPEKVQDLRAFNITGNSILLTWKSVKERCIKTYEIQYKSNNATENFKKINNQQIIFPSYQIVTKNNQTTKGYYRVRAIDFWDAKGQFSDIIKFA